jgi:hypothetical protein
MPLFVEYALACSLTKQAKAVMEPLRLCRLVGQPILAAAVFQAALISPLRT